MDFSSLSLLSLPNVSFVFARPHARSLICSLASFSINRSTAEDDDFGKHAAFEIPSRLHIHLHTTCFSPHGGPTQRMLFSHPSIPI